MKKNRSANVRRAVLVLFAILLIGHIFLPCQVYSKESTMPRAMAFATHPVGSLFYTLGSGLAKLFSGNLPTTVSVQPFTSAGAWFPMMNTGELKLGIHN